MPTSLYSSLNSIPLQQGLNQKRLVRGSNLNRPYFTSNTGGGKEVNLAAGSGIQYLQTVVFQPSNDVLCYCEIL